MRLPEAATVPSPEAHALRAQLEQAAPSAVALRRSLHASPDLSGCEQASRDRLLEALPAAFAVQTAAGSGAIAVSDPAAPSVIAVRAELDALPVRELSETEWSATNGSMHACGHDVHMAAAVALAHAVAAVEGTPPLALVFQPREEVSPSGALDILSGWRSPPEVSAFIGAHVHPGLPPGVTSATPGPVNAANDEWHIRFTGKGGHAAYPHEVQDVVLAASQFVVTAQQLVSRNVDPMSPAVFSIGAISAGEAANVLPSTAYLAGTSRTFSAANRALVRQRVQEIARGVALQNGCAVDVTLVEGEPTLENDPVLTEGARQEFASLGIDLGADLRSCGADDFAYYGTIAPILMLFVGVGGDFPLHHARFLPSEDAVLATAMSLLAGYLAAARRWTAPLSTRRERM